LATAFGTCGIDSLLARLAAGKAASVKAYKTFFSYYPMQAIADLHIHSQYSRATSKLMNIHSLSRYAKIKGIDLLGTGDFTHPDYFSELRSGLRETAPGIYEHDGMNFLLSTELSLIYTQDGRGRKVHNVILAPGLDVAEKITEWLKTKGRVDYDGRPIFGFSCIELVEAMRDIDDRIEIIPAHIWTPWFSLFGSMSGFDSVKECFQDQAKYINALETGLSSDPAMNWRVSGLDGFQLVSFSDSHSAWPWRLGREATLFDVRELDYDSILKAIRTGRGLAETIEVDPNYGKYHLDGHRNCNVCMKPAESIRAGKICPVCKRPLTIGVLHRIEELADRKEGFRPEEAKPFKSLIPLSEIIAAVIGSGLVSSKKVWAEHGKLMEAFGSEYKVLLGATQGEMARVVNPKIAEAVVKVREGRIRIQPGFDGEYGKPLLKGEPIKQLRGDKDAATRQRSILDFP
jgi:uncharacterized protein (TIGR00375 family)